MIKISGRGWKELYQSIQKFKETISKLQGKDSSRVNNQTEIIIPDEKHIYFATQVCEYIFYLVELDGKLRMDKLGITPTLFSNKKAAKQWRDKISKAIHPDHCLRLLIVLLQDLHVSPLLPVPLPGLDFLPALF